MVGQKFEGKDLTEALSATSRSGIGWGGLLLRRKREHGSFAAEPKGKDEAGEGAWYTTTRGVH